VRIAAGAWRGRRLTAPAGGACRPTLARVREALFDRLGLRVCDQTVVDLYAGAGALGLEALSRGAAEAWFVERDAGAFAALTRNVAALEAEDRCRLVRADVARFLAGEAAAVSGVGILFADPPYARLGADFVARLTSAPALAWARPAWIVVESSCRRAAPDAVSGWCRWEERVYGETRITIDERGE